VAKEIVAYSWAMVATSLVLWPLATGWVYGLGAVGLGAMFLVAAHRLERGVAAGRPVKPMHLFHLSIQYLTVLFLLVAVDALVR
jgi:protoheme IX farnesyltransferase